ncbi:glycosyltransferase family 4 protein [Sediminitomix flava]|uniref:Glycosyltransferase involved in cell wall biosynthesis n=1 Tax=Sediminitomix flava TaxID=379075 RepID=A0A315ZW04_SEDFL|nr:glycosyltransferase family 1 protein [Sediminitomix flava]PWJ40853.1 glycosyltransferase involved in cell wall biosynthesis [Sediminitomix flava]
MLKVGFDAKRVFNNYTGLGNYCRTLVENLDEMYRDEMELHLYTPRVQENLRTKPFLENYPIHLPEGGSKSYWRTKGMTNDLVEDGIDIFHGLSHELPLGLKKSGVKSVVTIHDLIFKIYPRQYNPIDNIIYNLKFKSACQQADKVVAISENTKYDIVKYFDIAPDKIEVIYQTCDESFYYQVSEEKIEEVKHKYSLPNEYLLYVGSVIERKKLLSVVEALKQMPEDQRVPLVVVGGGTSYKKKVKSFVAKHKLEKWVLFKEQIAFADFPALYQGASIFIYPSVYEGFGIPIIEALFSKTPVITSHFSCLPEAAGPNAYFVDPNYPETIAVGIEKIMSDHSLREDMILRGYQYVQRFHKEQVTRDVAQMYKRLVGYEETVVESLG